MKISSKLIIEEALKLWFEVEVISDEKDLYFISWNWQKHLFKNIDCSLNNSLWVKITVDKELTYKLLWEKFAVPKSIYISKNDYFDINSISIPFPLVVKPTDTDHWDWVTVNITDNEMLKNAISFAFQFSEKIIIQNFVSWYDHRVLVVWDKVSWVAMRKPPFIVWNWINTIQELIYIENENELRWHWDHSKPLSKIKVDNELLKCISQKNYNLSTILEKNEELLLRRNANLSTWWFSVDLTSKIHEENKKLAIDVTKFLWLQIAWVDILCNDISKPIITSNWVILEVNWTPWIRMHHYPSIWEKRNPALDILKLRFGL